MNAAEQLAFERGMERPLRDYSWFQALCALPFVRATVCLAASHTCREDIALVLLARLPGYRDAMRAAWPRLIVP